MCLFHETTWLPFLPINQDDITALKCNFPWCLLSPAGSSMGPWCWLCHIKPTSHLCWQARQRAPCRYSLDWRGLTVGTLGKLQSEIAALLDHGTQTCTTQVKSNEYEEGPGGENSTSRRNAVKCTQACGSAEARCCLQFSTNKECYKHFIGASKVLLNTVVNQYSLWHGSRKARRLHVEATQEPQWLQTLPAVYQVQPVSLTTHVNPPSNKQLHSWGHKCWQSLFHSATVHINPQILFFCCRWRLI